MRYLLLVLLLLPLNSFAMQGMFNGAGGSATPSTSDVSYISTSYGTATATPVSVTAPTSIQDGDMLIMFASSETYNNTFTCTGFTLIGEVNRGAHSATYMYKIASSESGDYSFAFDATSNGNVVRLDVFRKSGGSWTIPTTAGYNTQTTTTNAEIVAGPLDIAAGDAIAIGYSRDGTTSTVDTEPPGMTTAGGVTSGTMGQICYYETYSSAATSVSKSLTWAVADDHIGSMVVLHAE